ncbi:MAG TPA: hypothetical protein VF933_15610 [Streptosporangiaceae bacterium]
MITLATAADSGPLQLLYDGSGLSARLDHDPTSAEAASRAASALLDAALATAHPHAGRAPA